MAKPVASNQSKLVKVALGPHEISAKFRVAPKKLGQNSTVQVDRRIFSTSREFEGGATLNQTNQIFFYFLLAKIEEQEHKVPRVQTLSNLSGNSISKDLVLRMESWILNAFKWEVMIITSMNFLEYYLPASLYKEELVKNIHLRNFR